MSAEAVIPLLREGQQQALCHRAVGPLTQHQGVDAGGVGGVVVEEGGQGAAHCGGDVGAQGSQYAAQVVGVGQDSKGLGVRDQVKEGQGMEGGGGGGGTPISYTNQLHPCLYITGSPPTTAKPSWQCQEPDQIDPHPPQDRTHPDHCRSPRGGFVEGQCH